MVISIKEGGAELPNDSCRFSFWWSIPDQWPFTGTGNYWTAFQVRVGCHLCCHTIQKFTKRSYPSYISTRIALDWCKNKRRYWNCDTWLCPYKTSYSRKESGAYWVCRTSGNSTSRSCSERSGTLQKLFGVPINGFVPPWNSYDITTLQVLEQVGLNYLSASWETPLKYRGKLTVLPATCHLSRLRLAITEARPFIRLSPIFVVLMHHYDFSETGNCKATTNLYDFEKLLEWIKLQEDVQMLTLNDIAAIITPEQCLRVLCRQKWKQRLHWRLQACFPKYCFISKPLWQVVIRTATYKIKNSFALWGWLRNEVDSFEFAQTKK